MNWLERWRQKATNWLSDTPESFTSAFHEKKQMKERLEAALDQSTKRSGRAALVLAAAVILGLGGFAVWGISPTQKQTDALRVLCVAPEYTGRYSEFKAMEKAKARFAAAWPDVELTVDVRSFGDCRLLEHIVLEHEDLKAVNSLTEEKVSPAIADDRTQADRGTVTSILKRASWNVIRLGK